MRKDQNMDKMDELLFSVADEANEFVDYDALRTEIDEKQREKKKRSIWLRYSPIAAMLTVALIAGLFYMRSQLGITGSAAPLTAQKSMASGSAETTEDSASIAAAPIAPEESAAPADTMLPETDGTYGNGLILGSQGTTPDVYTVPERSGLTLIPSSLSGSASDLRSHPDGSVELTFDGGKRTFTASYGTADDIGTLLAGQYAIEPQEDATCFKVRYRADETTLILIETKNFTEDEIRTAIENW